MLKGYLNEKGQHLIKSLEKKKYRESMKNLHIYSLTPEKNLFLNNYLKKICTLIVINI